MRSKHHNINPPMANLSHVVNSLTFGPTIERKMERRLKLIPEEYFNVVNTRPMDNKFYANEQLHQAFHHYIKVIRTVLFLVKFNFFDLFDFFFKDAFKTR